MPDDIERRARPRRAVRHGLWLIGYVAAVHFCWAVLLVVSPDAQGATPVFGLYRVFGNRFLIGALLGTSAVLAGWLLAGDKTMRPWTYAKLLPQQFLLVFSAIESTRASVLQHYADGVPRPWAFITADQLPTILVAVFHTIVLVKMGHEVVKPKDSA